MDLKVWVLFLVLVLLVVRLFAYFQLTRYIGRLREFVDEGKKNVTIIRLIYHEKSASAGADLLGLHAIARKVNNAYRISVFWASILLWWPFVSLFKKKVYKAFNQGNLYLEWDPNPFIWTDLKKGILPKFNITQTHQPSEFASAVQVFESLL